MRPLAPSDLVDIAAYEAERPAFRERVIALKKRRRAQVGDLVTLVFENRDTVRFQAQEMMRAERIVAPERIQEELDTYNQLIPGPNELRATLLIEITEQERLREILDRFIGVDKGGTTFLVIGGERVEAEYEGGRSKEDRVSAVHYVTFPMTSAQAQSFAEGDAPASFEVAHRGYEESCPVPPEMRASLAEDLRSDS